MVTERQKLMADQIKIRRRQRKDTIMNLTRDNLKVLNAVTAAAASNPQPYINNLNNLNMLCKLQRIEIHLTSQISGKQIAAQQTDPQDVENQHPMHFSNQNITPTTSLASFQLPQSQFSQQITTTSAFSPATKIDSPQLVSSPLSTIGTEMSLSPQQVPRANSFDLGLLNNQNGIMGQVPQHQLLSAALSANQSLLQQDLKQQSLASGFDLTPPQSAGLVAPIPVNPAQNNNQLNLALLSQLLGQQSPVSTAAPSLLQFVTPQQPQLNLQEILLASLLNQFQGQQLSPPPEEKSPHKPNGFVDVCSV